ncbi:MAG: hypothetical protein ACOYB8_07495 [Eubacteriaceae bacterium]|jgi:hypothetical protein
MIYLATFFMLMTGSCFGQLLDVIANPSFDGAAKSGYFLSFVIIGTINWFLYYKADQKQNRKHLAGLIFGIVIAAVGILALLGSGDGENSLAVDLSISVCVAASGIYLAWYSRGGGFYRAKKGKKAPKPVRQERPVIAAVPKKAPQTADSIGQTIDLIQKLLEDRQISLNSSFADNLKESKDCLIEIRQQDSGAVSENLLSTIRSLVTAYTDIADNQIQTEVTRGTAEEIETAFVKITTALHNIYDKKNAATAMDISSDISAMDMMLRQQGLLDSDFKKKD